MDHAEKLKAVAGGLLKDKAATTEEQRRAEELADVPTLTGESMKELAQQQLAMKPKKPDEEKPEKVAAQEKELEKIRAKEKELQELTTNNLDAQKEEKAKKGETLKARHERHERQTVAKHAADETSLQIAAAEQELQDLYKQQLEEVIPHPTAEKAKHKTDRKKNQAIQQQQEQQREAKIAAMADERLAAVKEAVAPAEKPAGEMKAKHGKQELQEKQLHKDQVRQEKQLHKDLVQEVKRQAKQ